MRLPLDRKDWPTVVDDRPHRTKPLPPELTLPAKPRPPTPQYNRRGRRLGKFADHVQHANAQFAYERELRAVDARRCAFALMRAAFDAPKIARLLGVDITAVQLHALASDFNEVRSGDPWLRIGKRDHRRAVALALVLTNFADTAARRYPRHHFELHPFAELEIPKC